MSITGSMYFTIEPGTEAAKRLNALDDQQHVATKAAFKLLRELDVPKDARLCVWDGKPYGFCTNPLQEGIDWTRENAEVWRLNEDRYSVPRKNVPEGKEIAANFAALPPAPSDEETAKAFGLPRHFFFGLKILAMGLYRPKNHKPILAVPYPMWKKHQKDLPKGVKKMSHEKAFDVLNGEKE